MADLDTTVSEILALADEWALVSADGALNGEEGLLKGSQTRARLESRIREALAGQWVPVSERLPQKQGEYLVLDDTGRYWLAWYSPTLDAWSVHDGVTVVYWREKPAAPSGAAKEPSERVTNAPSAMGRCRDA